MLEKGFGIWGNVNNLKQDRVIGFNVSHTILAQEPFPQTKHSEENNNRSFTQLSGIVEKNSIIYYFFKVPNT